MYDCLGFEIGTFYLRDICCSFISMVQGTVHKCYHYCDMGGASRTIINDSAIERVVM